MVTRTLGSNFHFHKLSGLFGFAGLSLCTRSDGSCARLVAVFTARSLKLYSDAVDDAIDGRRPPFPHTDDLPRPLNDVLVDL
eukprot:6474175-Amphidinium_carterae.1